MKYLLSLSFCLIFLFSFDATAQTTQAIKLKKGAVSTIVSGKLRNLQEQRSYSIAVKDGQKMTIVQINSAGKIVSIYVTDPYGGDANDMDLSCHNATTIESTIAGKYIFRIRECGKADPWNGGFKLKNYGKIALSN